NHTRSIRKSTDMAMLLRIPTTILLLSFSRRVEQLTKRVKTFSSRSFGLLPRERVLPTLFLLLEPGLDCLVVFSMLVLSKSESRLCRTNRGRRHSGLTFL